MQTILNNTKLRAYAAFAGAFALIAEGAIELANHYTDFDGSYRLVECLLASGMLLTLASVYDMQGRATNPSKPMNTGFCLLGGGQLAIGLVAAASAANDMDVLGPVFALGALALVIGSVTVGITSLRRRELYAAVLPIATIAAFSAGHGGLVIIGTFWLVGAIRFALPVVRSVARPAAVTA